MHASAASAGPDTPGGGFRHEALLYQGDEGFLTGTLPYIQEGVAGGQPVLVVVARPKISMLEEALGADAGAVYFADMGAVGRNPARIIPAWRAFLEENRSAGRPFRGIGEPISPERTADELVECQRHESLLNVAFTGSAGWSLLCPYDTDALSPSVIDEAHRSHEYVTDARTRWPSTSFRGVAASAAALAAPLPEPATPEVSELHFEVGPLRHLREAVAVHAGAAGLDDWRANDIVLAVNEVVTNTLRHAGGRGSLRIWCDARAFICEIRDRGVIGDPLVGRHRPSPRQDGGRGLWIANQVCDLVQIRTGPEGSAVRMHMYR